MDFLAILLTFLVILIIIYYFYYKTNYFQKYGIPYIKPLPVVGNMAAPMLHLTSLSDHILKFYNFNKEAKYIGFFDFQSPTIIIRDPEIVKDIAIKYFDNFTDHRGYANPETDLFGRNLFSLRGDKWREVRSVLSPAFTSSKMKGMFKLMSNYSENFANYWEKNSQTDSITVNSKDAFTKYTSDVIATYAFGIDTDSVRNPENEFYVLGKKSCTFEGSFAMKLFFIHSFPTLSKLLNIKLIDAKAEQFFTGIIRETIAMRDAKGISRPDMIQLMMETRNKNPGQGSDLDIADMTSQAFTFFFGGFDTSSTLMSYIAHVIAANPDVQEKLRNEIDEVNSKCNGDPTYDMIQSMEYLDAVINETLRCHTLVFLLDRVCINDFELPPVLPGSKPFRLRAGDFVWIPAAGFHQDPAYFSQPEKFLPERFLGNFKAWSSSPTFIPFGIGPRSCIGNRFGLLKTKILFFHLISKCILKPSKKMKLPLKLKNGVSMAPDGGFWIEMESRNK